MIRKVCTTVKIHSVLSSVVFNATLQALVLSNTYLQVSRKDKLDIERKALKECLVNAKVSADVMKTLLTHYDFESSSPCKIQVR